MSIEDKELAEIFSGEDKPLHPDTIHVSLTDLEKNRAVRKERPTANTSNTKKTAQKPTHEPTHEFKDGKWEPVKAEPNYLDKLKACAVWALGFGGLSFLLFYWEQAGLMAESIAVPCIGVCTMLAGWGVGRNAGGK